MTPSYYAPPLIGGGIKRCFLLTSVAYIGPKSRTARPRKTKIGTEVAHITGDLDTTFKVIRSKVKFTRPLCSPPCWCVRRLQRWAWERVGCGKLTLPSARRRKALQRPRGGEWRGISWWPFAYSLLKTVLLSLQATHLCWHKG